MSNALVATVDEVKLKEAQDNFNLVPFNTRIFVHELTMPEKTEGGLYLPNHIDPNQREQIITEGIVIAVGCEITFCSPGDHIFYARYSGAKCMWRGIEYRVMNEPDLFGVEVKS